jgi:DNA-binding MarR family transcriptional regulator
VKVTLTTAGRKAVDAAMADLLVRERLLLGQLPPSEQDQLSELLRRLLSPFER